MSMNRLRPRQRLVFSGFSTSEVDKMEKILMDLKQPLDKELFQKIARSFNQSSGRAGKPIVKWKEVESWFKCRQEDKPSRVASSTEVSKDSSLPAEANDSNKEKTSSETTETKEKMPDISEWEFEARSSKDGAWYDVESFLAHRFVGPGEAEALVRFVGFGAEEDEWVNVKDAVRERSLPLENSECNDLKAGDLVCCFQERRDQAIYYDAHIANIERRMHDIRGCRCLFLIRYNHDNTEERVRLRRLCRRPTH